VRALGVVEPAESTVIRSKAAGQVIALRVQPGDTVTKGELLVQVDARTAHADFAQAEANLSADSATLIASERQESREKQLARDQGITQSELDSAELVEASAEAAVIGAQTQLYNAQLEVENTDVRSPGPGVVLSVAVNQGTIIPSAVSSIGNSDPLLTVGDLDTVEVIGPVDEGSIAEVSPGLEARVNVDAYRGEVFRGAVTIVEPQSVQQNNETMFPVHVRLANADHRLRPGMNAELEIQVGDSHEALAVPVEALRRRDDLQSAADIMGISSSDIREEVAKSDGVSDGNYAALLKGDLTAGDTVLILPSTSLIKSEETLQSRLKRATALPVARR
jgi:HlyD family secretion protein